MAAAAVAAVAQPRLAMALCTLVCLASGLEDGVALAQMRLHVQQPEEELMKRAEQVLQAVGPLELHSKPTVEDKENLLMAQALMKNPSLLRIYKKKRNTDSATTASNKASADSATIASNKPSADTATVASKVTSKTTSKKAVAGTKLAKTRSSKVLQNATLGSCSASDKIVMESLGGGNELGSLPQVAAKCGTKAFKLLKFSAEDFGDCMAEVGISSTCGGCFLEAARYGVRNCALDCMASWCSHKCLQCSDNHRAALTKCVGFTTPQATDC